MTQLTYKNKNPIEIIIDDILTMSQYKYNEVIDIIYVYVYNSDTDKSRLTNLSRSEFKKLLKFIYEN